MGRQHPAPASKVRIRLFIAVPSVKIKKDNPQANALWVVFCVSIPAGEGKIQSNWLYKSTKSLSLRSNSRSAGKIHRQKR